MVFIPRPVCRVEPRSAPAARSGWVKRPTTNPGRDKSASNVGSANWPVPSITIRILSPRQFGQLLGALGVLDGMTPQGDGEFGQGGLRQLALEGQLGQFARRRRHPGQRLDGGLLRPLVSGGQELPCLRGGILGRKGDEGG